MRELDSIGRFLPSQILTKGKHLDPVKIQFMTCKKKSLVSSSTCAHRHVMGHFLWLWSPRVVQGSPNPPGQCLIQIFPGVCWHNVPCLTGRGISKFFKLSSWWCHRRPAGRGLICLFQVTSNTKYCILKICNTHKQSILKIMLLA